MKNKIIVTIYIFLAIIFVQTYVFAEEADVENIINEQMESFEIDDFVQNAKKYSGNLLEGIDIGDILNSAINGNIDNNTIFNKFLNLIGSEVVSTLKVILSILVIVVIHSILKAISENLENSNIHTIIYYVQYILIITIIMSNFSNILSNVKETIDNLVGFMNILFPLLVSLMIFTGSIATSNIMQPIVLFMINFIGNIISMLIIPVLSAVAVLCVISKISDKIQITRLSKFMKSSIIWFLGIVLTLFVGVLSLEGTLSSSIDGITAKTTKAAVSTFIPVVGKILGDAVDTVLGCGLIIKNAVGVVGVIIIISICIVPIIKMGTLSLMYNLASSIIEPIADAKIVKLLEEISGIFKILLAILCSVSVMLIIGVTLVIKISNSGMMYR